MKVSTVLIFILFCLPLITFAQPEAAVAQSDAEEIVFEEAVRNFGFASGAAHQCASAAERARIESDVLKAYSGLGRLFGTDQAFFYAAAFGAGTVMPIDKAKCAEYTSEFNLGMQKGSKFN
jgi:hypothetical protein